MEPLEILILIFAPAFGAAVGSFLNVCIWRLPRTDISIIEPKRSHCHACGNPIAWYDNIPIISWIALGGRCRNCHEPVSVRYLIVELLTAALFAILAVRFLDVDEPRWAEFLVLAIFSSALIVASFVDIDLRIIPDQITLPGMIFLPFVALLIPGMHTRPADDTVTRLLAGLQQYLIEAGGAVPEIFRSPPLLWGSAVIVAALGAVAGLYGYHFYWRMAHPAHPNRLRDGVLAAVIIGTVSGVLWVLLLSPVWVRTDPVVSYFSAILGMGTGSGLVLAVGILGTFVFRKEAMGFGDVKLMGLLGGFAGWSGVILGFAIACLLGSLVGGWRWLRYRNRYLWFGPFLSAGCLLVILFPEAIEGLRDWYFDLFR